MASLPAKLEPGSPYPLGATWDGLGVNFAVFSANAERIELCLFDSTGRREIARLDLPERTDEIWHGYLPDARGGLIYGYRAHGPYEPHHGHRFNPQKLLIDPYARQLTGGLRWSDALFGYRIHSPRMDLSVDRRDSAPFVPKAVVSDDDRFKWGDDRPPDLPWPDTIIYEAPVRGLTRLRNDVRADERGTFAGLANPRVIDYLHRLGITAIELLPIYAFASERKLAERGLQNYWGYNPLNFFTIEPRFLSTASRNEMRVAVRRLHAAGIEVILDVVYNHTAEGNELGPTLSFRGLDNASYYRLVPDNKRYCVNDTGTGNTLNLSHPRVLQLVMDSLRYWTSSFHVDGFRFDLGVTLGREATGFDPGSGFFDALRQDPILARVKFVSEPWDLGPGGYQLGHHPTGFAEWNDRFRDSVRRFWRGDAGERPELAARLAGSSDLFDRNSRAPWASINYVASHDGFTLADVVSYAKRHNEANGEANNDGQAENYSANWGVEGTTADKVIKATRLRIQRAMLTTLMLSHGTPMLLGGDEFGRSQRGNNNAYSQDNEVSWLDFSLVDAEPGQTLRSFVARLIALRKAHPIFRARHFFHGKQTPAPGIFDIEWFDAAAQRIPDADWRNPEERLLCLRRAGRDDDGSVSLFSLLLNPTGEDREFRLPPPELPSRILIDSARPEVAEYDVPDHTLVAASRSAVLVYARLTGVGKS